MGDTCRFRSGDLGGSVSANSNPWGIGWLFSFIVVMPRLEKLVDTSSTFCRMRTSAHGWGEGGGLEGGGIEPDIPCIP